MKELKYLDVATAELIKNKITDACELLKNGQASSTPAVPYWTSSLQQTSVYVQLPCLYDVLIGHEIKSIVDDIMTALNEKNALAGVFTLHCIRTRELYELDKDGNEYMTGEDFNTVNISMQYHAAPTISGVLKTIENTNKAKDPFSIETIFEYTIGDDANE